MSELDDLRASNATLVAERNDLWSVIDRHVEEVNDLRVNKRRLHDNIDSLRATVAALTARNATLERVLADVERDVTRPIVIDVTDNEVAFARQAAMYRKASNEGANALRADIKKTLRTILAGATTDSPNERNHQ